MAPAEVIGGDDARYSRVVFNEITKNAIRQAFDKPGELNIDRVNAQQARRFMDRVVGYMVSPLLWKRSLVVCLRSCAVGGGPPGGRA